MLCARCEGYTFRSGRGEVLTSERTDHPPRPLHGKAAWCCSSLFSSIGGARMLARYPTSGIATRSPSALRALLPRLTSSHVRSFSAADALRPPSVALSLHVEDRRRAPQLLRSRAPASNHPSWLPISRSHPSGTRHRPNQSLCTPYYAPMFSHLPDHRLELHFDG